MKALLHGFRHYADFSGRDSRSVFWGFIVLTHMIFMLLLLPGIWVLMKFWRALLADDYIVQTIALEVIENGRAESLFDADMLAAVQEVAQGFFANVWQEYMVPCLFTLLAGLWLLIILLPTVSASARRMRDAGINPWWVLTLPLSQLVPGDLGIILGLVWLVLCCLPSKAETRPEGA